MQWMISILAMSRAHCQLTPPQISIKLGYLGQRLQSAWRQAVWSCLFRRKGADHCKSVTRNRATRHVPVYMWRLATLGPFFVCNSNTNPKVILDKLIVVQLVKKFSEFYEAQRSITLYIRAFTWLCLSEPHKWSPRTMFPKLNFNIILPPMPRSSKLPLPSGFQTKKIHFHFPSFPCSTHLVFPCSI